MNSRLDIIQAAVLRVKLQAFRDFELEAVNRVAKRYTVVLSGIVPTPAEKDGFYSSWAQYTILPCPVAHGDVIKAVKGYVWGKMV